MGRTGRSAWALVTACAAVSCAHDLEGQPPPERSFYHPIGLAATSDQATVFVVNSNFDQRYNAGWLTAISIDSLLAEIDAIACLDGCEAGSACVETESDYGCLVQGEAEACGGCRDHEVCTEGTGGTKCRLLPVLTAAIVQELRIPSLGGRVALAPDDSIGVITARGGQPLTLIELGSGCSAVHDSGCVVHCGDPEDQEGLTSALQRTDCDRLHLTQLVISDDGPEPNPNPVTGLPPEGEMSVTVVTDTDDRNFALDREPTQLLTEAEIADPFAVLLYERPGHDAVQVAIGYLAGTYISILEARPGRPLDHVRLLGRFGAFVGTVAIYPGATDTTYLAATSHLGGYGLGETLIDQSTIYDIDLERAHTGKPDYFRVHQIGRNFGGYELADLVFARQGGTAPRAYAANRDPDSIVVLDTELATRIEYDPVVKQFAERLVPRYLPVGVVNVPGQPSGLTYIERTSGPDLLAVAAFDDDALFILSVTGDSLRVDRRIDRVGQGPYDILRVHRGGRDLLLVTAFFDHAVAIIDITPADPQRFSLLGHLRNPDSVSSTDRAR